LTFAGKVLDNYTTLGNANIERDCTVHLSVRESKEAHQLHGTPVDTGNVDLRLLYDASIEALVHDFEKHSNTKGFLELNAGIISSILARDDLCVTSEILALNAMVRWAQARPER
jgi:hypothetical protein